MIPEPTAVETADDPDIGPVWGSPGGRFFVRRGFDSVLTADLDNSRTSPVGAVVVDQRVQLVLG